jgi:hypothetical protein
MSDDYAAESETRDATQATWTRLVGIDFGDPYGLYKGYKPFQNGERVPVDPPGTVAIVRGSRKVETEGGELMLEYVVELEQPGSRAAPWASPR